MLGVVLVAGCRGLERAPTPVASGPASKDRMAPAMDLAQDFQQNGFVRLKGFLSPADTCTLLADIQAAQAKAATSRLDKNGMTFRHNLWRQSQQLRDFIASEKVVRS